MASRSSLGPVSGAVVGVAMLAVVAIACAPATGPEDGSARPSGAIGGPSAALSGGPSPSVAGRDAPPDALLSAEGGDPATGQLGTYIWLQTGSDSPWLPGTPLVVGAGEPLSISLVPDGDIRAWIARSLPAGAPGPGGATTLAEGSGSPAFDAPVPGAWTVEVFVEFAVGVGEASYFWRLEVE